MPAVRSSGAADVDLDGATRPVRAPQGHPQHGPREETERHVHEEDPVPGQVVGEEAADERPDDGGEPPGRREVPLHPRALLEAVEIRDDGHAERDQRAAAETLERPADDQHGHRRRQSRQHRPHQEDRQSGEVHAPPAVEIREPPPERHGDRRGEDVAREDPRVDGEAAQARDHRRHGRRHRRRLHRAEEEPQHHARDDEPAAGRRRGGHGPVPRRAHGALGARALPAKIRVRERRFVPILPDDAERGRLAADLGRPGGGGRRAGAARAGRAERVEGVDAPVPVLPRHAEGIAPDERHGARAIRVGADQGQEGAGHGGGSGHAPRAASTGPETRRAPAWAARR